jgi:hypothetical protein
VTGIERDETRPGRKPKISARKVKTVVALTMQQRPDTATHCSTRRMAAVASVSAASVRRIGQANGLKPHRLERFKVSNDMHFAEKLEDIVGLSRSWREVGDGIDRPQATQSTHANVLLLLDAPLLDSAKVFAFEPNPIFPLLVKNLPKADGECECRLDADSDQEGISRLRIDGHRSGLTRLLQAGEDGDANTQQRPVSTTALAAVLSEDERAPGDCKLL